MESELVKIKYAKNPDKHQSELKKWKKFELLIKVCMRLNKKN